MKADFRDLEARLMLPLAEHIRANSPNGTNLTKGDLKDILGFPVDYRLSELAGIIPYKSDRSEREEGIFQKYFINKKSIWTIAREPYRGKSRAEHYIDAEILEKIPKIMGLSCLGKIDDDYFLLDGRISRPRFPDAQHIRYYADDNLVCELDVRRLAIVRNACVDIDILKEIIDPSTNGKYKHLLDEDLFISLGERSQRYLYKGKSLAHLTVFSNTGTGLKNNLRKHFGFGEIVKKPSIFARSKKKPNVPEKRVSSPRFLFYEAYKDGRLLSEEDIRLGTEYDTICTPGFDRKGGTKIHVGIVGTDKELSNGGRDLINNVSFKAFGTYRQEVYGGLTNITPRWQRDIDVKVSFYSTTKNIDENDLVVLCESAYDKYNRDNFSGKGNVVILYRTRSSPFLDQPVADAEELPGTMLLNKRMPCNQFLSAKIPEIITKIYAYKRSR